MRIKMKVSIRYADPLGPEFPQINFVKGEEVDVNDELGESILENDHGTLVAVRRETPSLNPESKDKGVEVESKEDQSPPDEQPGEAGEADVVIETPVYDSLSAKKRRFVDQYPVDEDETAAAIRAGYSKRTAKTQGTKLIGDDDIQAAIVERTHK